MLLFPAMAELVLETFPLEVRLMLSCQADILAFDLWMQEPGQEVKTTTSCVGVGPLEETPGDKSLLTKKR